MSTTLSDHKFHLFLSQVCCLARYTTGPYVWLIPSQTLESLEYLPQLDSTHLPLWLKVLDKCNLQQICPHLLKNIWLYWRSRDAFANVKLVMVKTGRGKDKTNRQLDPIMVLLGADGPVIIGLATCNCTKLWVLLSKFGESQRLLWAKARMAKIVMFAHYSPVRHSLCPLATNLLRLRLWHLRVLSMLQKHHAKP